MAIILINQATKQRIMGIPQNWKIIYKGKEYNTYGKLIFNGEYKKGQKWNGILNVYNYDIILCNSNSQRRPNMICQ